MKVHEIAVIVGSLRKDSYNKRLATAVEALAPGDFVLKRSEIGDLPLFSQDEESEPVPSVKRLKSEIAQAHGLLFVTPEYNRSVPGVLKNALDHGSRPFGHSVWVGKPAGILGVSTGALGTALAQQQLRHMLAYLDCPTLGAPEVYLQMNDELFDDEGGIGPTSHDFIQGWMERYAAWVRKVAGD